MNHIPTFDQHYVGRYTILDGHNKEQKHYGLTEAEDNKKRWQEYTEELHTKGLNDPDNHAGVITHLEPDILGSQVDLRKHYYEQN